MPEIWLIILFFFAGLLTFSLTTLTAGGGGLILVPLVNYLSGSALAAPILNTGNLLGRPVRLLIYWKHIDWKATVFYLPGVLFGAYLGAMLFASFTASWLQILVGIFLISTLWQFKLGKKKASFPMRYLYLLPLGLVISITGTLIGAVGPVLNPFYLNLGITKESLIATKTANSFFMGIAQISSYTYFGVMSTEVLFPALALGAGISLGSYLGKVLLKRLSDQSFRRWVIIFMVVSGCLMIYQGIAAL